MKLPPVSVQVCTLLVLLLLPQTFTTESLPLAKDALSRLTRTSRPTLTSNQDAKPLYRNTNDLNKTVWISPLASFLHKFTKTRLKRISKRSGIHPPKIPELDKSFNQSSVTQLPGMNSTQTDPFQELPPLLQPKVIEEVIFAKEPSPLDKQEPIGTEEPIDVDEPTLVQEPIPVVKPPTVVEPTPIVEPNIIDEHTVVEEPTLVNETNPIKIREPIFVEEPTFVEIPIFVEEPILVEKPTFVEHFVPEIPLATQTQPPYTRELSLLDIPYDNDATFWFFIEQTYGEVCPTRCGASDSDLHGGDTALCAKCWCDTACSVYGDCCPNFYQENGYTAPVDSAVQGCRSVQFPDTREETYYRRMIHACADSERLANLERYPKRHNGSSETANHGVPQPTAEEMAEARPLCLNPDPSSHWNQTRPITDSVTGLTFANQYCAQCSGISLETATPWRISVITTSSTLFSTTSSVLDIYRVAMTSDEAQVFYKPLLPIHHANSTVRKCTNYYDVSTMTRHLSRCNQTGLWRHYSRAAERACLLLNLPIHPKARKDSYRNVYCYYCNHDVSWSQVVQLTSTSPNVITGPGDNILSVLLDLDGSEEKNFLTSDPEHNSVSVTGQKCNDSQFYDQVKDECRDLLCAPGKLPAGDQTCSGNPSLQSNVFGYMACYLVTGIPGGSHAVNDLAARLAQEPHLVSSFGLNLTMSGGDKDEDQSTDYQNYISEALKATVVKTTRWTCNSCGLLGQGSDTAALLVQVAWATQAVLDRNQTEQILTQAQVPLIKLLDITVSASPGSAFHVGNLTVVKYPYCSIEENPVPDPRFRRRFPPPFHSEQLFVPAACLNSDNVANQSRCAVDLRPSVKIPQYVYTQRGELRNYVNLVQYLPVNSLLSCQFVKVPQEEYNFNIQDWSVRLNHCETDLSAGDVTISETDGAMFVCLKDYACWTRPQRIQNDNDDVHDIILRWMSLICTLLSMACCLITFLTYACLSQLRSSAGVNNMILAFLVFFAQGLAQFGSSQRDRHDICSGIGVSTHFFWLAAVAAMSTATYHMFYALSFPLRFQQYHGREGVLLRVYIALVLLFPALLVASTMLYAQIAEGNLGYASGRNCFVNAGVPKTVFFGVPLLILVLVNTGMYAFTVARLHGTPDIGETKIRRNNAVLYSKLSVATGASWIFGFLYDWTEFVGFAYAFMLTTPLLGLFLLLAFVANKRVMDMAKVKMPGLLAKLMVARGDSSASNTSVKKTRSTSLA